jgi:hypothetical protein
VGPDGLQALARQLRVIAVEQTADGDLGHNLPLSSGAPESRLHCCPFSAYGILMVDELWNGFFHFSFARALTMKPSLVTTGEMSTDSKAPA